ncbi:ParB N-terminal domain-containing protein [Flavobacterium sp.]|uniref:ParB N-terminal domain-containing protein n=1 Tax=Flavobacterium sp. TaxID=239 RepID=UPI0022C093BB|nr:ParB N-terminal domain-containing protein [Flavobacterium sp.]MCZ8144881.1 ParB N-terminal domain-containing protein [Flavobacterium sp.]
MIQTIEINNLQTNPINPRQIDQGKFELLKKSLQDFPDMVDTRPIVVNKSYVVLGGNMRLKAMLELGYTTAKIIVVDWSEEKQKEFIVKDNLNYGTWDWKVLSSEFDTDLLTDFGLDIPNLEFSPELNPNFNSDQVTEKDILRAEAGMSIEGKVAETIEVICPNCGNEFHVKN